MIQKQIVERKSGKPLNILLLEDDDGDAKALYRAFEALEIANPITRAMDGLEAFEFLKGSSDKSKINPPHLIVSDINMPRMDGLSFLQQLRDDPDLRKTIVFMLTTSRSKEDIYFSYEYNVAGYICKQTAGEDFINLTKLMSNYWDLVELPR